MGTHRLLVVIVGTMLLCAGCFSGGVTEQSRPPSMTSTDTPTTSPAGTGSPMDTSPPPINSATCPDFISFGEITADIVEWGPGIVRVYYTVPSKTELLFVVLENETVLGTERIRHDSDYAVDGWGIELDDSLEGPHTIRAIAYTDTNGDGSIDPTTDEPCRRNGSMTEAGPVTLDFSQNESTTLVRANSST